ncbi:MAG: tachylectin-related carbohydrate-binding protein, partial [Gemmatimonadaceae bacterium]
MAHVAIASDLSGTFFAIDHNGELFRNRHANSDGSGPLLHPGLGAKVGQGWGAVRHIAATRVADRVFLTGVGENGELVTALGPVGLEQEWSPIGPPQAAPQASTGTAGSAPLSLRSVFAGPGGTLYMITDGGALVRQNFARTSEPNAARQGGPIEVVEPAGWGGGLALFTNGDGVFFDITSNGTLRYQRIAAANDRPSNNRWIALARAWSRYQYVFGAGAGAMYAIGAEGTLERRRYTLTSDSKVHLAPRSSADVVGSGMFPWAGLAADIEGYCWPQSLLAGETVDFKVGTRLSLPPDGTPKAVPDPAFYTVEFLRLRR